MTFWIPMDIIPDTTANIVSDTILYNQFDSSYRRAHSVNGVNDAYLERKAKLIKIYMDLCTDFKLVEDAFNEGAFNYRFTIYFNPFDVPKNKGLWLFYDTVPTSHATKLKELIISINDEKLSKNDYTLLLYLSYQDEEEINVLKELPIGMLQSMYAPVYEASYDKWYQKKLAKREHDI
jgi:hypothetical protein